jgi:hypothetical protein
MRGITYFARYECVCGATAEMPAKPDTRSHYSNNGDYRGEQPEIAADLPEGWRNYPLRCPTCIKRIEEMNEQDRSSPT